MLSVVRQAHCKETYVGTDLEDASRILPLQKLRITCQASRILHRSRKCCNLSIQLFVFDLCMLAYGKIISKDLILIVSFHSHVMQLHFHLDVQGI